MRISLPQCVRQTRPLVHAITNYVTMDWVARGLLAAGARPFMALDRAEAAAVAASADALVLNIGTWSPSLQEAMLEAGRAANVKGIPVVLDPVGAGGLPNRTEAALQLLSYLKIAAVRGNGGEVAALAGHGGLVRGVDAAMPGEDAERPARAPVARTSSAASAVAARFGCIVAATGEIDVVSDGGRTLVVRSGHPLMARVPGAGCLGAAVVTAALAVGWADALSTVAQTLLWLGAAGEEAARLSRGPGSFAPAYLDALAATDALPAGRITPPLAERLAVYVIISGTTPMTVTQAVLKAGVGVIQFREKRVGLLEEVAAARQVRDLCRKAGALFLVNDRVDLAQAVEADGVHLGQEDLPVAMARRILGPDAIIGATCETEAEARSAALEGADYIGTGPIYATPSKADAGEPYGPAIVERISRACDLPVIGIGGIGPGGAAPVIRAGACGVAAISSVVGASDPEAAARTLLREVSQAKGVGYR